MNENPNMIARRSFLGGALAAAICSVPAKAARETPYGVTTNTEASGGVSLREKFFGCIAGCHIGSAMGAPVEGWSYERIEREHGLLDKLLPYSHYGRKDWVREPGTTEDGIERQKLMIIKQTDYATSVNPHTCSKRTLRESSEGLYNAFQARLARMKTYTQEMESA